MDPRTRDRRHHSRVTLRPRVPVSIQGPLPVVHEGAVLDDVSTLGLGVVLPGLAPDLEPGDRVRLVIDWPEEDRPISVRGIIQERDATGRRLCIRLEAPTRDWDEEGLLRLALHRREIQNRLDAPSSSTS